MKLANARPGQADVITTGLERLRAFVLSIALAAESQWTTFILPTGYGKSDVFRCLAWQAQRLDLVPATLVLSPNETLRDQIVSKKNLKDWIDRYAIDEVGPVRTLTSGGTQYDANGEWILSSTVQLVLQNLTSFQLWVDAVKHRCGRPPLIAVDETQSYTEGNQWGSVIEAFERAGCPLLVGTATAWREDGDWLKGWKTYELLKSEACTIWKTRPHQAPEKIIVQEWAGDKHQIKLTPHIGVPFKDAWNANLLCHISHDTFDVNLKNLQLGDTEWLSEVPAWQVRRVIGTVVRHPFVIKEGCRKFVETLHRVRRIHPGAAKCAGIIFSANDPDSDHKNDHANEIAKTLRSLAPALRIVIATSADGEEARARLKRFCEDDDGDVLIVKQMAALGLDAPRTKVILDLSPIRAGGAFVQRVNRATRIYQNIYTAHLITPDDVLSRVCFQRFIADDGGAQYTDLELVREYDKDKDEPVDLPLWAVQGVKGSDIADSKANWTTPDRLEKVAAIVEHFPQLYGIYTIPELAEHADQLFGPSWTANEPRDIVNTGDQLGTLQATCSRSAKSLIKIRFVARHHRRYTGAADSEKWAVVSAEVWAEAKQRAGIPLSLKVEAIENVEQMNALLAALEAMIAELSSVSV